MSPAPAWPHGRRPRVCVSLAESDPEALRGAFEMLSSAGHDPQHVFLAALDNARPALEMRTMARLQVPYPLNPRRAEMYAMKWIIGAARGRKMKGVPPTPSRKTLHTQSLAAVPPGCRANALTHRRVAPRAARAAPQAA